MEFIKEINAAIKLGLDEFQKFIREKLQENQSYLERPFWINGGRQITVLNYLIHLHHQKIENSIDEGIPFDLTRFIDEILNQVQDKNIGLPLHQAISESKIELALHLLENFTFNVDHRDEEGRTLLSLALTTKDRALLTKILDCKPNIHAATRFPEDNILFQPLHQAILLDFASGVNNLTRAGADVANPVGVQKDTPLLLAAGQGKIKALEALLEEAPVELLKIDAENDNNSEDVNHGETALEALCRQLERNRKDKELIRGVAMLLCRGAEPPRKDGLCQLLADRRSDLLKEIDAYMDTRPGLVDPFVNRCHITDSALYKIMYVDHSWGSTLRQLFGKPSDAAFAIERLVTRKYSRRSEGEHDAILPTAAAVPLRGDEPPLKLYAEFVRRYNEAYENQRIPNPWSTMRWLIAEGKCNWSTVKEYARNHPGSRTQIIFDDMFKTLPKMQVHEKIENATVEVPHENQVTL
ncbi:ankyrin repeat protein [Legionella wadsworthii]|uniref:Ankyrin repeat protein n=1 Tax=Legionella wadsworthii TaxID=28088 RepID=A0A378LV61_9GAMM|nr:Dot/Icm T4SS effector AnkC/LegA12 [Legionella wadsworthii]STY30467.1 ankyrin repeat protein [Legionella wadsworthii]